MERDAVKYNYKNLEAQYNTVFNYNKKEFLLRVAAKNGFRKNSIQPGFRVGLTYLILSESATRVIV